MTYFQTIVCNEITNRNIQTTRPISNTISAAAWQQWYSPISYFIVVRLFNDVRHVADVSSFSTILHVAYVRISVLAFIRWTR